MPGGWQKETPPGGSRTATPAHRTWRGVVLHRDGHLCQLRYTGCTVTATEADHIIEVADGGPEFDPDNGQAACTSCHARKTAAHANRTRWRHRDTRTKEQHPGYNR